MTPPGNSSWDVMVNIKQNRPTVITETPKDISRVCRGRLYSLCVFDKYGGICWGFVCLFLNPNITLLFVFFSPAYSVVLNGIVLANLS